MEEIFTWIDEGSPVDITYLTFQKAFDKVPHQRLLLKLKAHDIKNGIIDWIEQWLTDKRQRVVEEVSNWKSVLSWVPQGSVLLHTGHGNLDVNYKIGDTVLGTTIKETD